MKDFEMADVNDPADIIRASQASVLAALKDFIENIKKDIPGPGLTWTQIDLIIDEFKKKEPTIIYQDEVQ